MENILKKWLNDVSGPPPTEVCLQSIEFLWEGSTAADSSLPVLPDFAGWAAERRSFAAYSIADVKDTILNNGLRIRARFRKNSAGGRIQVRNSAAESYVSVARKLTEDASTFHTHNVDRLGALLSGASLPGLSANDVLGTVAPATVYFNKSGDSVYLGTQTFVPLLLENVKIHEQKVGIFDIDWKWEYRMLDTNRTTEDEDFWQDKWYPIVAERPLNLSRHRVFVILSKPNFPWTPFRLPNFDTPAPHAVPVGPMALTIACDWAAGSSTLDEAARKITDALYSSGRFYYSPNPFYYKESEQSVEKAWGMDAGDDRVVLLRNFFMAKVIERLSGGEGLGKYANCLDCALIVATLANLLGCNLRVAKLQNTEDTQAGSADFIEKNRFEINTLRAIGHPSSQVSMSALLMSGKYYFTYHAIAWEASAANPTAGFNDPGITIYDACVRFVSGVNEKGEEQLTSPAGLTLGIATDTGKYLVQLASNTDLGRPRCKPQQATEVRAQLR